MIGRLIGFSARNKALVLLLMAGLTAAGLWAANHIRLDAIPDLSDVQVIVVTEYPGQNPETVDDQVTYPLTTALLAVPGARTVRGVSMFELSFVYVIFDDGTDLYWARSRVLEYLNFAQERLPPGVSPRLGPDATSVGWVYQYALVDGFWCKHHPQGLWRDDGRDIEGQPVFDGRAHLDTTRPPHVHTWAEPAPAGGARESGGEAGGGTPDGDAGQGAPVAAATHAETADGTHWYARPEDAPEDRRAHLVLVRVFDGPGRCPLDGSPLQAADQDLASLRSLQDWYLRYPLTAVDGVAEVASLGGFVKQYQVLLDPVALQSFHVPLMDIERAIRRSNDDVGGSVVEQGETEFMVRSRGYVRGVDDLRAVVVATGAEGTPVTVGDIAVVQEGGQARRGVGELDGRGEAVGGVVIARFGENANQVIRNVKERLSHLQEGLPPGTALLTTYDRSALIERAVGTLREAVIEELIVTALICLAFLGHVRSALVAILVLPIGLLAAILVMNILGINANIMSLGGLALAIGVMVDSAVVMVENAHKHIEREEEKRRAGLPARSRTAAVIDAAQEVGPSLFYSLLVITVAFLPIFVLGQESGRLFKPLAWTKTLAIAAGSILGVTVVPVLMVLLVRGKIPHEDSNPLNRLSMRLYDPVFRLVMRHPLVTLLVTLALGASAIYPYSRLGSEFMPPLEEGDLLYMPSTDPGLSVTKARELLQQTDKLIAQFPEVLSVHGKAGRCDSATDPAPLSMLETLVRLEPDHSRWRHVSPDYPWSGWPGWARWPFDHTFWPASRPISQEELLYGWNDPGGVRHVGLNEALAFPGVANAWPYPIEARLAMLSTGIKTPVGIKVMGPDLQTLSDVAGRIAAAVRRVPGTISAWPERAFGGWFLDVDVDRAAAARYGLVVGDVQDVVRTAIGGMDIATTVEGLERYPIQVRYLRELRDDPEALRSVLVDTPAGAQIPLGQLADIEVRPGPPMVRSENGVRSAWVFVDMAGRDLGGYVADARRAVAEHVTLPTGYTLGWSGRFEALAAANRRLSVVVPITLGLIVLLLYASNRSWFRVGVVLLAVPFSLIGVMWFLWAMDYNLSLAVWVGVIALLGIDAETGQVMLLYLDTTWDRYVAEGRMRTRADLFEAIHEGAVRRIRPKTMTVATDLIGLLPLLWVTGTGADMTRRLVAPLIGGITVSFLMELLVYPVIFWLWKLRRLPAEAAAAEVSA